jgi:hypothetical protein
VKTIAILAGHIKALQRKLEENRMPPSISISITMTIEFSK